MSESPRRNWSAQLIWPLAALVMALLVGCQSTGGGRPDGDEWLVVERTGEAHASLRSSSGWTTLSGGDLISTPSTVVTGPASRVILARGDDRVRLGPAGRAVLLPAGEAHLVEQMAGVVDYRIGGEAHRTARIRTPHGDAESPGGVFRIDVGPYLDRTAFAVSGGALRIATPDGTRGITIRPGQEAEGRDVAGPQLTFRRHPGGPLEAVAPVTVPVLAQRLEPATPAIRRTAVAAAAPERHPGARSTVEAHTPASRMRARIAAEPEPPDAVGDPERPVERIILPATFLQPGAEAPSEKRESEQPAGDLAADPPENRDLRPLTEGLLEGLDRNLDQAR